METEILKLALSQGIFAVLFIWLLFWVLKENAKREAAGAAREAEFQRIISELLGKVRASICDVQDDLKEIKDKFFK